MSCNNNNNPCKDLGCLYPSNTDCVWLKGIDTNCLGIKNKDLLTDALNTLISEVCSLSPSGIPNNVVVNNSDGNLIVTDVTVGNTTTYTVNLNSAITTDISLLQADIASLQICCNNSINGLLAGTDIGVTDNFDGTWTINYTGTPTPVYDGIIGNDFNSYSTVGSLGNELLNNFTWNYINDSVIAPGDEIRFEIVGSIETTALGTDEIILQFYGQTIPGEVAKLTYSNIFNFGRAGSIGTYSIKGVINVATTDQTTGNNSIFVQLDAYPSDYANSTLTGASLFSKVVPYRQFTSTGGVELNGLTINLFYNNISGSSSSNNGIHKFMVEVRKKI